MTLGDLFLPESPSDPTLESERLILRPLTTSDVTASYIGWMNDAEVMRYLESRFEIHTLESITAFVANVSKRNDILFFAILHKENGAHIGNIKLGSIHPYHRTADIGLLIGDRRAWGQGFATEAIRTLSDFALNRLDLHKVMAGCYAENIGALRAFEKAGFQVEAQISSQFRSGDHYTDHFLISRFGSTDEGNTGEQ